MLWFILIINVCPLFVCLWLTVQSLWPSVAKELAHWLFTCFYNPALKKVGDILDLPCPFGIPWFCHSVIIHMKLEYLWGQLASVDQSLYEASLWWGKGCIRFWDRLDKKSGFHGNRKRPLTDNGENDISTFTLFFFFFFFYQILFKPAGNTDRHNISNEFEFRPDRITPYRVRCPWGALERLKKFPSTYNGEMVSPS